jgi:hypothetical protein
MGGVDQRTLWRLLVTDLADAMDNELFLSVGKIQVAAKRGSDVEIDVSGLSNESSESRIEVRFPQNAQGDMKSAQIQTDWSWKGRIWECFEREYEIQLRLELKVDEGLAFHFHARRLQQVLRDARRELVTHVRDEVKTVPEFAVEHVSVYEGEWQRPHRDGMPL